MNNGPPFFYDYINATESGHGVIHAADTRITRYFQRYFLQKAISVFKWSIPDWWAENFLLYCLYCWGYVAVFNTDKFGVIFQPCGLSGYDVFYRPTTAVIANPLLSGNLRPRIGTECELLRLQPDYGGLFDIVTHYAELMAISVETLTINLFNSKLSYVFFAQNDASAKSFKKLYDQLASGNPAAVIDKSLLTPDGSPNWQLLLQNVGQNYIVDKVLSDMRKIEAMFDTDIGIPNANTDKRERLITDEVNSNNIETLSKCSLWLEELKKSCKAVNTMFGINISVDWRYKLEEVRENAANRNNERPGAVQMG